jgi:hypothetical protein
VIARALPGPSKGWRSIERPIVASGMPVLAAFLLNELLMGLVPRGPLWWSIPYFPLRTVGVPFVGLIQVLVSVRLIVRGPRLIDRVVALSGIVVAGVVVWFNWSYNGLLFFDRWQR